MSRILAVKITFQRTLNIANNNKILDPLRAKKTFIRKKMGHTAVSAIQASSVAL